MQLMMYKTGDIFMVWQKLALILATLLSFTEAQIFPKCTFESGSICPEWQNSPLGDFNWTLHSGRTRTASTGPSRDHTIDHQDGHYIFIETSLPQKEDDEAVLVTSTSVIWPKYRHTMCLDFWYHMYGDGIGSLTINLTTSSTNTAVWRIDEEDGRWLNGWLEIKKEQNEEQFDILFIGRRGRNERGDIALDDIRLKTNKCPDTIKVWKDGSIKEPWDWLLPAGLGIAAPFVVIPLFAYIIHRLCDKKPSGSSRNEMTSQSQVIPISSICSASTSGDIMEAPPPYRKHALPPSSPSSSHHNSTSLPSYAEAVSSSSHSVPVNTSDEEDESGNLPPEYKKSKL